MWPHFTLGQQCWNCKDDLCSVVGWTELRFFTVFTRRGHNIRQDNLMQYNTHFNKYSYIDHNYHNYYSCCYYSCVISHWILTGHNSLESPTELIHIHVCICRDVQRHTDTHLNMVCEDVCIFLFSRYTQS